MDHALQFKTYEQQLEERLQESDLNEFERSVVFTIFRSQGIDRALKMIIRLERESGLHPGQLELFGGVAR